MAAMFRSSSLENTEEMSLFEREKDNYFVTDEDCRSEVRLSKRHDYFSTFLKNSLLKWKALQDFCKICS